MPRVCSGGESLNERAVVVAVIVVVGGKKT